MRNNRLFVLTTFLVSGLVACPSDEPSDPAGDSLTGGDSNSGGDVGPTTGIGSGFVHVACGNNRIDGSEICDGNVFQLGRDECDYHDLGTGAVTCLPSCYLDFSACQYDMCAVKPWADDDSCDPCELLGGTRDPDCTAHCGADGTCAEFWSGWTGVWTCTEVMGAPDPDCTTCGNGLWDSFREMCDGDQPVVECADYDGFTSGQMSCTEKCLPDFSGCS